MCLLYLHESSIGILSAVAVMNTYSPETEDQRVLELANSGLYIVGNNASTEFVVDGGGDKVLLLRSCFLPLSLSFCQYPEPSSIIGGTQKAGTCK